MYTATWRGMRLAALLALVVTCQPGWAASLEEKMSELRGLFQSSYSGDDYYRTDELLVTATGTMRPLYKAPAVASIVTAREIEQMGAVSLDDILETVPGLHVSPSPLNRLDPVYSIRGIHTGVNPQVLFLVNGLPVIHPFFGARPPAFRLPVSAIARVEVIRGPGSAVYGADAFAGVINVITKEAGDIRSTRAGIRAGSHDFYDAWLEHGTTWGGWRVAATLEWQKSGIDPNRIIDQDLQTTLDRLLGTAASQAPGPLQKDYDLLDGHLTLARGRWTIRLWGWLQQDAGTGSGIARALPASDSDGDDIAQLLADLLYRDSDSLADWDLSVRLSYLYIRTDSFLQLLPPGAVAPIGADGNIFSANTRGLALFTEGAFGNPQGRDHHLALDLVGFYTGFASHLLRLGAGAKYIEERTAEAKNFGPGVLDRAPFPPLPGVLPVDATLTDVSATPYVYMDDQRRRLVYLSLQDEWPFARYWSLTAGVRYDHYSDFGDTVNSRLALVWEARPDLSAKLLYGEAFRPPSFNELFSKNNPAAVGSAGLDPETIRTWELALDYQRTPAQRWLLNLFCYQAEDLIAFRADPATNIATARNVLDLNGHGFEIETQWRLSDDLRLRASFSYQRATYEENGQETLVPDAPGMQAYANLYWTFRPRWSLDTQLFWIADRRRPAGDTRQEPPDYTLANLTLRRTGIAGHWDAALAVRNLFDEDAREPAQAVIPNDYPMPGRTLWAEIRYTF